ALVGMLVAIPISAPGRQVVLSIVAEPLGTSPGILALGAIAGFMVRTSLSAARGKWTGFTGGLFYRPQDIGRWLLPRDRRRGRPPRRGEPSTGPGCGRCGCSRDRRGGCRWGRGAPSGDRWFRLCPTRRRCRPRR